MNQTTARSDSYSIRVIDLLDTLELCLKKASAANRDMVNGMFRYEHVCANQQQILLQYEEAQMHSMIVEDYCAKMKELLYRVQQEILEIDAGDEQ